MTDERPSGVDFQVPLDPTAAYRSALAAYTAASQHDPDNMLARLRAANCLERLLPGKGRSPWTLLRPNNRPMEDDRR